MLLSKCLVWDSKILSFVKEQEQSRLLSKSEIKAPLRYIYWVILYFRGMSDKMKNEWNNK